MTMMRVQMLLTTIRSSGRTNTITFPNTKLKLGLVIFLVYRSTVVSLGIFYCEIWTFLESEHPPYGM